MKKRYIVSTRFYNEYFKDFLDEKKIEHTNTWNEENVPDRIITVDIDEEQERAIAQFLRFPCKNRKKEDDVDDK